MHCLLYALLCCRWFWMVLLCIWCHLLVGFFFIYYYAMFNSISQDWACINVCFDFSRGTLQAFFRYWSFYRFALLPSNACFDCFFCSLVVTCKWPPFSALFNDAAYWKPLSMFVLDSFGRRGGSRIGASGRGRGRGTGRGGGRGRGRGRKDTVDKSAEQLDKELETYHAEAMNISWSRNQQVYLVMFVTICYWLPCTEAVFLWGYCCFLRTVMLIRPS